MEEQKRENKEELQQETAEEKNSGQGNSSTRSSLLWIFAGGYLVYTGYRLCASVISGAEDSGVVFLAAGGIFVVIGAVLLIMAIRNLAKAGAQKHELEEAAAKKAAEEAARKAAAAGKTNNSTAKGNTGSTTTTSTGSSSLRWPCPASGRITSGYGNRKSPTAGASSNHKGIDISASTGSSIVAAAGGTVSIATYSYSAGNYVVVNHGNGLSTVYMHCSQLLVSAGDTVKAGQTIAKVGSTGYSTGSHLHFAVRKNGSYVNPSSYVSP